MLDTQEAGGAQLVPGAQLGLPALVHGVGDDPRVGGDRQRPAVSKCLLRIVTNILINSHTVYNRETRPEQQ